MNKILFLILIPLAGYCAEILPNNLTSLDLSIQATKQQHEMQVALREEIVQFEKLRDQYVKNPEDKELLSRLANRAQRVQETMKQANLAQLFDPEFVKEINLFSRFASI